MKPITGNQLQKIELLETSLWAAADNLRANSKLTAGEYCMPVLGVIFLLHATNRYNEALDEIQADQAAGRMPKRPLTAADFKKRRALLLPKEARYDELLKLPKDADPGAALVDAMNSIERDFEPLLNQLPKDYTKFENTLLEDLLRVFDTETLRTATGDIFGRINEYFLMKFAMQGAQDNGEFFTPPSLVQTIVNVIEPDHGIVFDPACGSAIYKKLQERRDTSDVTELLKELHRIVNEAIRTQQPGDDQSDSRFYDLSAIDLEKLREEFAKKVKHKATAVQDMRELVEEKLQQMLARNPQRMDYYKKYSEIVADYNREKDRVTMEETFAKLADLNRSLDVEARRAAEEGLSEDELALFDLLQKADITKAERERVKLASKSLLESVTRLIAPLERWTEKEQTQAEVEVFILDHLFQVLPSPPFSEDEKQVVAKRVYQHVWQQSASGRFGSEAVAA